MKSTQRYNFVNFNKRYSENEKSLKGQKDCLHEHWIARCSNCRKILACDTQNVVEEDILNKVVKQRYVDYTGNENIKLNGKEIIWKKTK